jgi:hypothetical protein
VPDTELDHLARLYLGRGDVEGLRRALDELGIRRQWPAQWTPEEIGNDLQRQAVMLRTARTAAQNRTRGDDGMARKRLTDAGPIGIATKKRKSVSDMIAGEESRGKTRSDVIGVMYQIEPRHRDAVQDAAKRARDERGGAGRADASAMLRALLEDWIAAGAKLPKGGGEA